MKRWMLWAAGVGMVAAAAGIGYWIGTSSSSQSAGGAGKSTRNGPVVPVRTIVAARQDIAETVLAYGTVEAPPGKAQTLSLPFEIQVTHLLVVPGQPVDAGTPLLRIRPSAATELKMRQAHSAMVAAQAKLQTVRQQYRQHLVVRSDLISAQRDAEQARQQWQQWKTMQAGSPRTLTSRWKGVVSRIAVDEGGVVQAGTPLLTIASGRQMDARLGVEPEDAGYLHVGDAVTLTPVHAATSRTVTGHVRVISGQVDPKTRLLDVDVGLPDNAGVSLGAFVQGRFATLRSKGVVVPRAAVLPDGQGYEVFTVEGGKARKHHVRLGLETDATVELRDGSVSPGDKVVTEGNYELADGMAVSSQDSP